MLVDAYKNWEYRNVKDMLEVMRKNRHHYTI